MVLLELRYVRVGPKLKLINVLKMIFKCLRFVPFGPDLTQFGTSSGNPA